MAKEIRVRDVGSTTLYCLIYRVSDNKIAGASNVFEDYNSANYADYGKLEAATDSQGDYIADFPALPAGIYDVKVREKTGASRAESDLSPISGAITIDWNGSANINNTSLNTALNAIQTDVDAIQTDVDAIQTDVDAISGEGGSDSGTRILVSTFRHIRAQVESQHVTSAGDARVYITVPNWPVRAILTRLSVFSTEDLEGIRVRVLSNRLAYQQATDDIRPTYTEYEANGDIVNYTWDSGELNQPVTDKTGLGMLYVELFANTGLASGAEYWIQATGTVISNTADTVPFHSAHKFRVLRVTGEGKTLDVTDAALRNNNAYGLGGVEESATFVAFASTGDYLYIGSTQTPLKVLALVPSAFSQAVDSLATIEYWNGSAWTAATVTDTTVIEDTSPNRFHMSGVIEISGASWAKRQIDTDPLKVLENQIRNGDLIGIGFFSNPDRYWARIKMGALSPAPLKLAGLLPLE